MIFLNRRLKKLYSYYENPNIASKKWVIDQYDTMVGTNNMSTNVPSDAGIVNLKGTKMHCSYSRL